MKRIVCAVFLFFTALPLKATENIFKFTINKTSVYQSEVLQIWQVHKSDLPFSVDFLGKKRDSFLMGGHQTVLIGIDYQLKPGTYSLTGNFELNNEENWSIYCRITVKEKYRKLPYRKPPILKEKKEKSEKEKEKEKIRWGRLVKEMAEKKNNF